MENSNNKPNTGRARSVPRNDDQISKGEGIVKFTVEIQEGHKLSIMMKNLSFHLSNYADLKDALEQYGIFIG